MSLAALVAGALSAALLVALPVHTQGLDYLGPDDPYVAPTRALAAAGYPQALAVMRGADRATLETVLNEHRGEVVAAVNELPVGSLADEGERFLDRHRRR